MTDDIQQPIPENATEKITVAAEPIEQAATPIEPSPTEVEIRGTVEEPAKEKKRSNFFGRGGGGNRRGPRRDQGKAGDHSMESDYEEKNVEVARVTRVTKGGKRMRFRTLSVIGNRKGRVGFGLAKGVDVAASTAKATAKARKSLMTVPIVNETIPYPVEAKFSAARILLKPAPKGTGVKAGGAVRIVLELAGVQNVVSKILGSKSKINNVKATFVALKKLKLPPVPETKPKPSL
ncbi:MAG: 30S ribosomal protein S5 [Patescibacteria group bacterium]